MTGVSGEERDSQSRQGGGEREKGNSPLCVTFEVRQQKSSGTVGFEGGAWAEVSCKNTVIYCYVICVLYVIGVLDTYVSVDTTPN